MSLQSKYSADQQNLGSVFKNITSEQSTIHYNTLILQLICIYIYIYRQWVALLIYSCILRTFYFEKIAIKQKWLRDKKRQEGNDWEIKRDRKEERKEIRKDTCK